MVASPLPLAPPEAMPPTKSTPLPPTIELKWLGGAAQAQLNRGARLTELLKQPQYQPVPVHKQVLAIFLGTTGGLDGVEIADVQKAEADFLTFMESSHAQLVSDLEEKKELTADITERLTAAVEAFKKTLVKSEVPAEATS